MTLSYTLEAEIKELFNKSGLQESANVVEIEKLQMDIIETFLNRQRMDNYEISIAGERKASGEWAPFY